MSATELSDDDCARAASLRARVLGECSILPGAGNAADLLLTCLIAGGHALVEGAPGSGKTSLVKRFAMCFDLISRPLQMTADLYPSDVLGRRIYGSESTGTLRFQPGPVFCNLLLLDQLNQASPRMQAALLEVMSERTVTLDGHVFKQLEPFMVCATQTPLEGERDGYRLTVRQLDRFMLRLTPRESFDDDVEILAASSVSRRGADVDERTSKEVVLEIQPRAERVAVEQKHLELMSRLRELSGASQWLASPLSMRALVDLRSAARARALLDGRRRVSDGDILALARPVLGHRLTITYEAEAEEVSPEQIVNELLEAV